MATAAPQTFDPRHPHDHDDAHSVPTIPENDGSLACRAEDFLMSSSFFMQLNDFAKRHASKFEEVTTNEEHRHEWYEIFKEYEAMVSARIDCFLAAEGVSAEDVVAQCRQAKLQGKTDYAYFEYLAACVEYETFHRLMLEFKSGARDMSRPWELFTRR
eukprot:TRINITY_DN8851_c0_g1_i1.p2 TRINITY_DN8851_c0_g1~~TRINITY_DN8851_c0_g1_i1.p2  ORF type:complete len:158 (-),score=22.24 TRINITY_DN8851_c0_g1_i1:135-608(-)